MHGTEPEQVHFHEVGAVDSVADVVGVCAAVHDLGIETVLGSPIAIGAGTVRIAHGRVAVPAPAVAQLCIGWPTALPTPEVDPPGQDQSGELATPTGVALVRALSQRCLSSPPAMVTAAVGVGAGSKDLAGHPNVVRAFVGAMT